MFVNIIWLVAFAALLVSTLATRITTSRNAGWWVGILFTVHPVHSQAVNYISARSEMLSVLAVLAAYLLMLTSRRELPAYLAYAAGLLVKSSAIVLLPLAAMHRWVEPLLTRISILPVENI